MAIAKKPVQKSTAASASSASAVTTPSVVTPAVAAPEVVAPKSETKSAPAGAPVFLFPVQAEAIKPLSEIQEQIRAGAEKGLEQFRTHYATMKGNAEIATDKLEESIAAVQAGTKEFQAKVVDLFRAQADANFTHLRALFGAKSLTDAIKLQQDFAKAQVETIQSETRTLAELAHKVASDVTEPVKASLVASLRA